MMFNASSEKYPLISLLLFHTSAATISVNVTIRFTHLKFNNRFSPTLYLYYVILAPDGAIAK